MSVSEVDLESAPGAGLVICAISAQTSHVEDLLERQFEFPSAEMVDAAASMFPLPEHVHNKLRAARSTKLGGRLVQFHDHNEGPFSQIEIGPGIVRVSRHDVLRSERTLERLKQARIDAAEREMDWFHEPMVWASLEEISDGTRKAICTWSAKSRARMIATICELDLSHIVAGDNLPCMITLTLPGDWLAVTPDAATAARKFHNFTRAWEHKWGPLRMIWKREFQRRGAPHWHLWTVPPVPMHRMREFNKWLSATWTRCLDIADKSERAKSLGAGTNVSFAEGLRARDPKRLAVYFLKESLGGEGKAYQNGVPVEWDGQSAGRFWGYRGLEKAVAVAPLDGAVSVQVVRTIRRWQRAQGITRQKRVPRFDLATGELKFRNVRRPASVIGSAGWVAVNDGAAFASQLARYASMLALDIEAARHLFADNGREYVPAVSPWLCELPSDHPAMTFTR